MAGIPSAASSATTILLVDDDESIRDLGERILKREGYNVLTAPCGKEALDIYGQEQDRIALVILDLSMPRMGGEECLDKLLKIDPAAKVIISTGLSPSEIGEPMNSQAKGFVNKPYEISRLLQAVRDVVSIE
jgi:two-component system cell cycle sensor histidine kinase/response regulator CckA